MKNKLNVQIVISLYFCLVTLAIMTSLLTSLNEKSGLLFTLFIYLLLGIFYNVPPFRLKNYRFVDVIVESANNPLRLIFGWLLVSQTTIPPLSLVLCFWFIGLFLMTSKRLAEKQELSQSLSEEQIQSYRKSLGKYSYRVLVIIIMCSSQLSASSLLVFTVKYSADFLPFYMVYVIWTSYFFTQIGESDSIAQAPEKLVKTKSIVFFMAMMLLTLFIAYANIPISRSIEILLQSTKLGIDSLFNR